MIINEFPFANESLLLLPLFQSNVDGYFICIHLCSAFDLRFSTVFLYVSEWWESATKKNNMAMAPGSKHSTEHCAKTRKHFIFALRFFAVVLVDFLTIHSKQYEFTHWIQPRGNMKKKVEYIWNSIATISPGTFRNEQRDKEIK